MATKHYIVYYPLTFELRSQTGRCDTSLDLLSFLTGLDASKLSGKNFTDFLKFDLSKRRRGLAEINSTECYAAHYIANQIARIEPDSRVIVADGKRRTLHEIIHRKGVKPAAVFISALSANFPTAAAITIPLNHARIPVVIGGIHVSTSPQDCDMYIRKYVPYPGLVSQVLGPGDSSVMGQILSDLARSALKPEYSGYVTIEDGIWGQDNVDYMVPEKTRGLKDIPFLGKIVGKKYVINPVTPYSGCSNSCHFCSISSLPKNQRSFRARSPEDFIAELKYYQRNGVNAKNRIFFFLADNLMFGGKTLEKILDHMIASDLKVNYTAQISIDAAENETLLKKLRLSGAIRLFLGLESLDLRNLEHIGKYVVKNIKKSGLSVNEYYAERIKKIQDSGIPVIGAFIYGLPYDYFHSLEDNTAMEVANFCLLNHITLQPAGLTDLPGSINFKKALAKGKLVYGEPGTMDYLLGLCAADITEGNSAVPDSLKNSPLVLFYMIYESAQIVDSLAHTFKNALYLAKRSWRCPTKTGKNSLFERTYEVLLTAGSQLFEIGYSKAYDLAAYSANGTKGTFERLYDREQNPEVKALFKDYVQQFL